MCNVQVQTSGTAVESLGLEGRDLSVMLALPEPGRLRKLEVIMIPAVSPQ